MSPILLVAAGLFTVLFCIIVLRLHAFISLTLAALVVGLLTSSSHLQTYALHNGMTEDAALKFSAKPIGNRLAEGFGETARKVGVLIAFASVIGTALHKSGAAERIVRSILKTLGAGKMDIALISSSFTLGIPVFFDTVFYLLIPIVKSAAIRQPAKYSLYLMCAIAGGVMTHSLVPPTPGPLFVARELNVDIGLMIMMGILVGAITVAGGYLYARFANRKWPLPIRDTADVSVRELEKNIHSTNENLPGLGISLLPILLPILLISMGTFIELFPDFPLKKYVVLASDGNIALLLSMLIALRMLWARTADKKQFEGFVSESLSSAGMIILITCAGGAFGQLLQQTDIGDSIGQMTRHTQLAILPLAFFLTLLIRTAQGSATVAMVTSIGFVSGLGQVSSFGFHPVYLALAIGCGSKIFPWMNDSAFWIISRMSGMTNKECIRFFSYLLTVMALVGLAIVMILAWLFPLI